MDFFFRELESNPAPSTTESSRLSNSSLSPTSFNRTRSSESFSPTRETISRTPTSGSRSESQIQRTLSLKKLTSKNVEDIAQYLVQKTKAPSLLLDDSLRSIDDTINDIFDFVVDNLRYRGTLLHFVCFIGEFDFLKRLVLEVSHLNLEALDANHNLPLHVAQVNGYSKIVALLLSCGATPQLFPGNVDPKNAINSKLPNSVKKDLKNIWTIHYKHGPFGIAVTYPELAEFAPPRPTNFALLKDKVINIKMKVDTIDEEIPTDKQKLLPALTKVLQSEKYISDFKELEDKIKEHFKDKEEKENVTSSLLKISPLQAVAELFSINILVYISPLPSSQGQSRISSPSISRTSSFSSSSISSSLTEYVFYADRDYMRDCYPIVYLGYDGCQYHPIVHHQDLQLSPSTLKSRDQISKMQTQSTPDLLVYSGIEYTAEQLCTIILEEGPVENLQKFLKDCQHTHINEMVKGLRISQISVDPNNYELECTPLYLACRLKRYDYVMELLKIEKILVPGVQEGWFGNTVLHAASWRGPPALLALLLCNGHVTGIPFQVVAPQKRRDGLLPQDEQIDLDLSKTLRPIWDLWEKWLGIGEPPKDLLSLAKTPPTLSIRNPNGVNVRRLCYRVDSPEPPSKDELKTDVEALLSANVNLSVPDALFRCTLFFLTCRNGNFPLVQTLLSFRDIRPDGAQETYSGDQNTPLHVATWRGHVNLVALLLTRVQPEPKRGGNLKPPNTYPEINYNLPKIVRNRLDYLFDLKRKGKLNEKTNINEIIKEIQYTVIEYPIHTHEENVRNNVSSSVTNEKLLYHTQLEYIWYEKIKHLFTEKFVLADLTIASQLDLEYRKYLKNKQQEQQMTMTVHFPPSLMVQNWTMENWKMNWQTFEAPNRRFYPVRRVKTWYWQSEEGCWFPFPYNENANIARAVENSTIVEFQLKNIKSKFKVDGGQRTCIVSRNEKDVFSTHIIHEEELNQKCNWEPDQFELETGTRKSLDYPLNKATLKRLNPESPEFKMVEEAFYITIPRRRVNPTGERYTPINQIKSITKIFYPANKEKFLTRLAEVKDIHQYDLLHMDMDYTKLLWHGTGNTDPKVIYNSTDFWSVQYSKTGNLYGKGTYFAANSVYSKKYAHETKAGNKVMFLAQVIVGCGIHTNENGYLVDPPDKTTFDTVVGMRNNSWIYVQYASTWAFPVYLVEWSEKS